MLGSRKDTAKKPLPDTRIHDANLPRQGQAQWPPGLAWYPQVSCHLTRPWGPSLKLPPILRSPGSQATPGTLLAHVHPYTTSTLCPSGPLPSHWCNPGDTGSSWPKGRLGFTSPDEVFLISPHLVFIFALYSCCGR